MRTLLELARPTSLLLAAATAAAGQTVRESVADDGTQANGDSTFSATAGDGRFVAFFSDATNLVPGDTNVSFDVFLRDTTARTIVRVSVASDGAQGNKQSSDPAITPDGRFVVFASEASNLVANDTNHNWDVFRHDLSTGETILVSVASSGVQGDAGSVNATISSDGRYVAFQSLATNLVAQDRNGVFDVFRHDCQTGKTQLVSEAADGGNADNDSHTPAITGDGTLVAFLSEATNLLATPVTYYSIYLRDCVNDVTEIVSIDDQGRFANGDSYWPTISTDGRYVAFESNAPDLVPGDTNSAYDAFVRDRLLGTTLLASRTAAGIPGNGESRFAFISADGSAVAFQSKASDLVPGDANGKLDTFVCRLASLAVERASLGQGGSEAHGDSTVPSLNADGTRCYFTSVATDLVPADTNQKADIFRHELSNSDASWSIYGAGWPGTLGVPSIALDGDPVLGTTRTLLLGTSCPGWSFGFVFLGASRAAIPTRLCGTLLVAPLLLFPLSASPFGASLTFDLPNDTRLSDVPFYFQWLEADPGASKGASFSAGLEMVPGI